MPGVAIVELVVPARDVGDEGRRGQQGAVGLTGGHVDAGRGAGEVCEVEGVGGEGAVGVFGDGGEFGGGEGGGDVVVDLEEFGAAAVVEVEGGEDYVDGFGFPAVGRVS